MQQLPYADAGRPDLRSPVRFLLWLGRQQWRTLAVGALFGTAWMVSQALVPAAIGRGLDAGVAARDMQAAARWSLVVLFLALVQAAAGVMRHRISVDNWLRASFRAMQLLGEHVARTGVAVRRKLPTGEVVSAASNDALYIGGAFDITARLTGAIVSFVLIAVLLLRTSVLLGTVVLVGVPALMIAVAPLMHPLQQRQREQREVAGRLSALGADTVAGLRVLRGIGGEPAFFARYRGTSNQLREAGVRVAGLHATLDAAQVLLPGVFLALITWMGARLALEGTVSPGDVVAFYGYAFFLVVPIRTAIEAIDKMTRSVVGARRIVGVLETAPAIADAARPAASPPVGSALVDGRSGLVVPPGRLLGLVSADPDETAQIALRLGRLIDDDHVALGTTPLRSLSLATVRQRVLVSEAEPRLFTGVLRDELDPWGRAESDHVVLAGLHVAAAEDVLESVPDGLDSHVDEGGRSFSGGQRQRLTLARNLLADPEILVLVEPTSSVDAHTEAVIAERLRAARHGEDRRNGRKRTTVLTTTSPLLLDRCDMVALVVDGRIRTTGTHRELIATDAIYRETVIRGEDV